MERASMQPDLAAIAGSFADAKLIKSRSVLQLHIEIAIEQADAALAALGGIPQPGKEKPVAVALLNPDSVLSGPSPASPAAAPTPEQPQAPAKDRRTAGAASSQDRVVQRCAILCGDPGFQNWLRDTKLKHWRRDRERPPEEWTAMAVRKLCGVTSRRDLALDNKARDAWTYLEAEYVLDQRSPPHERRST